MRPGNRKPKGKRSAPKAEDRRDGKKQLYAYIWSDPSLGELPILNSPNAWWLDAIKLQKLVDAYKFYATDDQACYYAGINMGQLRYFQELHPDFFSIKHAAKQDPTLRAKKTVVSSLEKNPEQAHWWLERLEKDTFSTRTEQTGAGGKDLYDGLSQQIKTLTEEVIKNGSSTNEKYPDEPETRSDDAGQSGDGDEAEATADVTAGQDPA